MTMTQMQIMANNHNVMMFLTGMSIAKRNNSKLQLGACVVVFNYHQNLVCFQLLPVIQHLIYVDLIIQIRTAGFGIVTTCSVVDEYHLCGRTTCFMTSEYLTRAFGNPKCWFVFAAWIKFPTLSARLIIAKLQCSSFCDSSVNCTVVVSSREES